MVVWVWHEELNTWNECVCSVSLIPVTTTRAIIMQLKPVHNTADRHTDLSMSMHVSMCASLKPDLFRSLTIYYNYSIRPAFMGLAELKLHSCLLLRAALWEETLPTHTDSETHSDCLSPSGSTMDMCNQTLWCPWQREKTKTADSDDVWNINDQIQSKQYIFSVILEICFIKHTSISDFSSVRLYSASMLTCSQWQC